MAQEVKIILRDDLDGSIDSVETVRYGIDGVDYEIDLNDVNADELRTHLERYVPYSRRTGGRKTRNTPQTGATKEKKERLQAIREWAKEQNLKVSDRGRISQDIIDQYDEENS